MHGDPKLRGLVKWQLATNLVIGSVLCLKLAQGASSDSDFAQFKRDTRQIERLFLDPESPAISLEDRRRVARTLFPKLPDAEIERMIGGEVIK